MQVISFIDIFLRYTSSRTVLCVVPVNTLQNWVAEIDKWLPNQGSLASSSLSSTPPPPPPPEEVMARIFSLFVLSESTKTMEGRLKVRLAAWGLAQDILTGGQDILGYG